MLIRLITIPFVLALSCSLLQAGTIAIFPFELIDTSYEGEVYGVRTDETRRLALITEELRRRAASDGRFNAVDMTGITGEIERAKPLYKCDACALDLARRVGAEQLMTGTVQKVSNLILNINIYMREAESGKLMRVMSVDIRGNTDETWLRGLRWLLSNRLLSNEAKQ
jgi:Protein of unknown function (DUF2380)